MSKFAGHLPRKFKVPNPVHAIGPTSEELRASSLLGRSVKWIPLW